MTLLPFLPALANLKIPEQSVLHLEESCFWSPVSTNISTETNKSLTEAGNKKKHFKPVADLGGADAPP